MYSCEYTYAMGPLGQGSDNSCIEILFNSNVSVDNKLVFYTVKPELCDHPGDDTTLKWSHNTAGRIFQLKYIVKLLLGT